MQYEPHGDGIRRLPPPDGRPGEPVLLASNLAPGRITADSPGTDLYADGLRAVADSCSASPLDRLRCLGIEAGCEAMFLKPRFEDGAEHDGQGRLLDYHLDAAPRFWLNVANPSGLGLRSQFWWYDNASRKSLVSHIPVAVAARGFMEIRAYTVDLEIVQQRQVGPWQLALGAGARYGSMTQTARSTSLPAYLRRQLDAAGPALSVQIRRPFGDFGFAWVVNARGSLLSGRTLWEDPASSLSTDDVASTAELQVGLEVRRCIPRWGMLMVRSVWEQQNWFGAGSYFSSSGTVGEGVFGIQQDDHDIAFMGFGFALGLER
jgi:hypothetical protein